MTTLGKKKQIRYQSFRDEFITFDDIFSLALAFTSIRTFSSDIMNWHRAVYEICQKYKKSIPELRPIYFDHSRPPLPPMADQVYGLKFTLMMSGELEWSGHILRIPEKVRPKIRRREEGRLANYLEQIKDMAKIFDKHLKVKNKQ